jgi:hypothetical protein
VATALVLVETLTLVTQILAAAVADRMDTRPVARMEQTAALESVCFQSQRLCIQEE